MGRIENLTPHQPGQSGNLKGRPKGRISVGQRIRAILEKGDGLPKAVKEAIENVVGEGMEVPRILLPQQDPTCDPVITN